ALRQWSSARDIPWRKLVELPDEIERAVCQICTQLTQLELVAVDVPARWIGRVSREFHEVKLFLAAQIRDEAGHVEVLRKRASADPAAEARSALARGPHPFSPRAVCGGGCSSRMHIVLSPPPQQTRSHLRVYLQRPELPGLFRSLRCTISSVLPQKEC